MLASRILDLRKNAGMSQLQLAQKLNVCQSTIGMYEQGRRTPAIDMLVQMAKLFDVSLDYLVTGREIADSITSERYTTMKSACPCRRCCFCLNKPKLRHSNYFQANAICEEETVDVFRGLSPKRE